MKVYSQMNKLGVVAWFLGAYRMHKDGDGYTNLEEYLNGIGAPKVRNVKAR